jgi:hypothetical protein
VWRCNKGSRNVGSGPVAIAGWVASIRWRRVEPDRGSEYKKMGTMLESA